MDFAFGVLRAIRVAEKKIAAALPGILVMAPALCRFVVLVPGYKR